MSNRIRLVPAVGILLILVASVAAGPFDRFQLPPRWQSEFWARPETKSLLAVDPKELAERIPAQVGFRFCRCPTCGAAENEMPLVWSPEAPDDLACRLCKANFPNLSKPPKEPPKTPPPEEVIEVRPSVLHKYPYQVIDPIRQTYPDERVYLQAKRDYEVREYFTKVALYAAIRHRDQPPAEKDPNLVRLASVILLRFAQVYPDYAMHFDQPGQPKILQPATVAPPYRRGYATGKWDWSAALDVSLNLVIAHALIRDEPLLLETGRALGIPDPVRKIENDFFRASARFIQSQPIEDSETALHAHRGLLAVGRLLDDARLIADATARVEQFLQRGFAYDGLWRHGDTAAHRRIVEILDGWLTPLLTNQSIPRLALARRAGDVTLTAARSEEIQQVSWSGAPRHSAVRGPALLGGSGVARLAIGSGADALDIECRGLGNLDSPRSRRLALRLAIAGRPVLTDLDDLPPTQDGFDLASASHNTVLINGMNQRESLAQAQLPAPGAETLFFVADPDFQVAILEDRYAYPRTARKYRQWIAAIAGPRTRYAVTLFEIEGGFQHDQLWHAAPGWSGSWDLPAPTALVAGPETLLPPGTRYIEKSQAGDGRWFLQALGAFHGLTLARLDRPAVAELQGPELGVRLHLLGAVPTVAIVGRLDASKPLSPALILRRRATDERPLLSAFVTVLEPLNRSGQKLRRVGRVDSPEGTIQLVIETDEGTDHLVLNLRPGQDQTLRLADGRTLNTNGLLTRVSATELIVAGGESASIDGIAAQASRAAGVIRAVRPGHGFETDQLLPDPESLSGRTLLIQHGDGTSRGWTLDRVENHPGTKPTAQLHVREETGFQIDPRTGFAHYDAPFDQPHPGPHTFVIARIARQGLGPHSPN